MSARDTVRAYRERLPAPGLRSGLVGAIGFGALMLALAAAGYFGVVLLLGAG